MRLIEKKLLSKHKTEEMSKALSSQNDRQLVNFILSSTPDPNFGIRQIAEIVGTSVSFMKKVRRGDRKLSLTEREALRAYCHKTFALHTDDFTASTRDDIVKEEKLEPVQETELQAESTKTAASELLDQFIEQTAESIIANDIATKECIGKVEVSDIDEDNVQETWVQLNTSDKSKYSRFCKIKETEPAYFKEHARKENKHWMLSPDFNERIASSGYISLAELADELNVSLPVVKRYFMEISASYRKKCTNKNGDINGRVVWSIKQKVLRDEKKQSKSATAQQQVREEYEEKSFEAKTQVCVQWTRSSDNPVLQKHSNRMKILSKYAPLFYDTNVQHREDGLYVSDLMIDTINCKEFISKSQFCDMLNISISALNDLLQSFSRQMVSGHTSSDGNKIDSFIAAIIAEKFMKSQSGEDFDTCAATSEYKEDSIAVKENTSQMHPGHTTGSRISFVMNLIGMNDAELTAKCGLTSDVIDAVLSDESESVEVIAKIADALHMDLDWLTCNDIVKDSTETVEETNLYKVESADGKILQIRMKHIDSFRPETDEKWVRVSINGNEPEIGMMKLSGDFKISFNGSIYDLLANSFVVSEIGIELVTPL